MAQKPNANYNAQIDSFSDILDYIKNLPIIDVAKKLGIDLSKYSPSSANLVGPCPTGHPSVSGKSFTFTPHLNLFNCFNCKIGGSSIDLVKELKNISFIETVEWFIKEYSIPISLANVTIRQRTQDEIDADIKAKINTLLYEELLNWGKQLLYDKTTTDQDAISARNYLTQTRNYSELVLQRTEIFYIPSVKDAKAHLTTVYPEYKDEINNLSISGRFGDEMKIAFPYRLHDGTITGLIKRHYTPAGLTNGTVTNARWDASFETKKTDMFGLPGLVKMDKHTTKVILVEGYPDSMYMQALGMPVLAIGTGIPSDSQLDSLNRLKDLNTVIVSLDNDATGLKNSTVLLKKLSNWSNIVVEILPGEELAPSKDLDEYLRTHGETDTTELIKTKSMVGVEWYIKELSKADGGKLKLGNLDSIIDVLAGSNSYVKNYIIGISKKLLNLNPANLKSMLHEKQIVKYRELYDLTTKANPILNWNMVPFMYNGSYWYLDRKKSIPDILSMTEEEIKQFRVFNRVTASKSKQYIEDCIKGYITMPPVFPSLSVLYDPHNFYEIDIKTKTINTFIPSKWMLTPKTDEVISPAAEFPLINDFLSYLLGNDGIPLSKIYNWIGAAFKLREKLTTSLVIVGTQGAGKSTFIELIMGNLLGAQNFIVAGDREIESDYNEFIANKLLVVFNELSSINDMKKRNAGKLKGIISDEKILINKKFRDTEEILNTANLIFMANPKAIVLVEGDDRRYHTITVPSVNLRRSDLFKKYGFSEADFPKFKQQVISEFPRFVQYLINKEVDVNDAQNVIMNATKQEIMFEGNTIFVQIAAAIKNYDLDELLFLHQNGHVTTANLKAEDIWDPEHMKKGFIEINQALSIVNRCGGFTKEINANQLRKRFQENGLTADVVRLNTPWTTNKSDNRTYIFRIPK